MKLSELKGYIPVIITRNTYDDLLNQIEQGEKGTFRENTEKRTIQKAYDKLRSDFNEFEINSNKEIKKIKQKNEELTIELSEKVQTIDNIQTELLNKTKTLDKVTIDLSDKNQTLEYLIKEKEIQSIRISELEEYKKHVDGQKGGYTKEINKLKKQLEELENKNKVQAEKIQELTKTKQHTIEEYKNNGLRKSMKKKRG